MVPSDGCSVTCSALRGLQKQGMKKHWATSPTTTVSRKVCKFYKPKGDQFIYRLKPCIMSDCKIPWSELWWEFHSAVISKILSGGQWTLHQQQFNNWSLELTINPAVFWAFFKNIIRHRRDRAAWHGFETLLFCLYKFKSCLKPFVRKQAAGLLFSYEKIKTTWWNSVPHISWHLFPNMLAWQVRSRLFCCCCFSLPFFVVVGFVFYL